MCDCVLWIVCFVGCDCDGFDVYVVEDCDDYCDLGVLWFFWYEVVVCGVVCEIDV